MPVEAATRGGGCDAARGGGSDASRGGGSDASIGDGDEAGDEAALSGIWLGPDTEVKRCTTPGPYWDFAISGVAHPTAIEWTDDEA